MRRAIAFGPLRAVAAALANHHQRPGSSGALGLACAQPFVMVNATGDEHVPRSGTLRRATRSWYGCRELTYIARPFNN